MNARIARLAWDELTALIAGIEACGQVPADELDRLASLPDDDYYLARSAYHLAAGFARRGAEQQQEGGVTIVVLGTEEAEIDTLVSYPGNARRGSLRVVRESIAALGQYRPLVVRRRDGKPDMILCGHTTRDALVAEGHATARIDVLTCSDDEARRINLIDNRSQELASWDTEALTAQLETFGDDFTATGFSAADASRLMFGVTPELDDDDGDDGELWGVVAECDDEQAQAELLARLDGEGYKVRALIR